MCPGLIRVMQSLKANLHKYRHELLQNFGDISYTKHNHVVDPGDAIMYGQSEEISTRDITEPW